MSKKKSPEVEKLESQVKELTEALQRERADATNLRRRTEEERAKMGDYYKAVVLRKLLPALDNLERALKHVPKDLANNDYVRGVQGVVKQFEQNLNDIGVQKIKSVGERFDPSVHEAIHMEDGEGNVEVVCEELQPGYKLNDEVIRHAIVKVKMEKRHG